MRKSQFPVEPGGWTPEFLCQRTKEKGSQSTEIQKSLKSGQIAVVFRSSDAPRARHYFAYGEPEKFEGVEGKYICIFEDADTVGRQTKFFGLYFVGKITPSVIADSVGDRRMKQLVLG